MAAVKIREAAHSFMLIKQGVSITCNTLAKGGVAAIHNGGVEITPFVVWEQISRVLNRQSRTRYVPVFSRHIRHRRQ